MAERIPIQPDLLRWARNRANLAVVDVVASFPKYADWESGQTSPTMRQLEDFARRTRVPFGYLFLNRPPAEQLPIPDFRSVRDRSVRAFSPELLDTIHLMQRRQDWAREELIDEGAAPVSFVASLTPNTSAEAAAQTIRRDLGLAEDWAERLPSWNDAVNKLVDAIESAGILVMTNGVVGNNTHRRLDVEEFRGFVLIDDHAPLIFVNNTDAKSAQMFTLAHELVHVWLGEGGISGNTVRGQLHHRTEKHCNAVAAELLAPAARVTAIWDELKRLTTDDERLDTLARQFRVSRIVAARRALDLRLIKRAAFDAYYQTVTQSENKKSSGGGDFHATKHRKLGDRFSKMIARATTGERLPYAEAYRLTGLFGKTFTTYMASYGDQA